MTVEKTSDHFIDLASGRDTWRKSQAQIKLMRGSEETRVKTTSASRTLQRDSRVQTTFASRTLQRDSRVKMTSVSLQRDLHVLNTTTRRQSR